MNFRTGSMSEYVLVCDLDECLNRSKGEIKTSYFRHLGGVVHVNEKRHHTECLIAKHAKNIEISQVEKPLDQDSEV